MLHFIYKWDDPRDKTTRYVGLTNNPNMRIEAHFSRKGANVKKEAWLQELLEIGMEPIIEIVEVIYDGRKAALGREKYWVEYYFHQGHPLLNIMLIPKPKKEPKPPKFKKILRKLDEPHKGRFDTEIARYLDDTKRMKGKKELSIDEIHATLDIYAMVEVAYDTSEYSNDYEDFDEYEDFTEWYKNQFKTGGMLEGLAPSMNF